jgi:hypothetical protein
MQSLDIVELLQNNPVTKLSCTYQSKLLIKLKEKFTDTEQQMFLTSFYCYLHFNVYPPDDECEKSRSDFSLHHWR